MNSQPIEGDKIFANHVSDKRFLSRVYKSPYNSITKPQIFNQKMVKGLKDKFLQGRYTNGHAYMLSHFCHV